MGVLAGAWGGGVSRGPGVGVLAGAWGGGVSRGLGWRC